MEERERKPEEEGTNEGKEKERRKGGRGERPGEPSRQKKRHAAVSVRWESLKSLVEILQRSMIFVNLHYLLPES